MVVNEAAPGLARICPHDTAELAAVVADANAHGRSFELVGGGTKRAFGEPFRADALLDLSGMAGIEFYEPEELVIKVRAGTPVSIVRAALAEHRQQLAFEPPDYGALFGGKPEQDTIGGIIACNLTGPRRVLSGAARDAVLGVEAVNGRGEAFKGGGRTVKNVTGYDMPRLMTGSFGTLAVLASVTLKIQPAWPDEITLLAEGLGDAAAIRLLGDVLRLPFEVSAAAHMGGVRKGASMTALRLEGFGQSVKGREVELVRRLGRSVQFRTIEGEESGAFWRTLRDLHPFVDDRDACLWRLMLPGTHAARIVASLGGDAIYDWGGSLVFVRTDPSGVVAHAASLRQAVATVGGQACLLRAPEALRRAVGAFQPRAAAQRALGERVRRAFDPNRVLNPGRLERLETGGA
ncbi:glycolate oxidase subunit GlcE [Burkholderia sp. Ac-20344]|uniref:glycolate oxidase subunit GlcE n=1 Tax=Burkholderia sp. Ac-20344 TaxID=2703890 RepID=UPI00197C00E4|nr:glycolate oxidase subunit GlcE [Burkholderia sp. Ac-20344]MBN3830316.1 glycolate oxidase subunit GlcE [Burkholderia sp. Ac-20344]